MLGVALMLVSGGAVAGESSAAQPATPVLIGALTDSWDPPAGRARTASSSWARETSTVIGVRFTQGDPAELPVAAQQLVERGASILVTTAGCANAAMAVRMASDRVPIVFIGGSDPVGMGMVRSLARPGGNITGVADLDAELAPKRLQHFKELVPGLKRVLLPYDAGDPYAVSQLDEHREAARRVGVTLVEKPLRTQDEARAALLAVRKAEVDGILSPRNLSLNIPGLVLEIAPRRAIPTMFYNSWHVERGGLASYSPNTYQLGRQAARLVDKIIRGAKPADVPVEQATMFELVINLKSAKSLGLTIPPSLLLRADRLIE
jgi:putative ABC transport system substrate-binding protein